MKRHSTGGFTLIEILIVVAIIGILSLMAGVKLSTAIQRTYESRNKAHLKTIRTAISMYTADNGGRYPSDDLTSLITGGYLKRIPPNRVLPYHWGGNTVGAGSTAAMGANPGHWYYFNVPGEAKYGQVVVNCNHPDSKGVAWDQN